MSVTKAKINLKDGTVELEGSEAFVSKYLDTFKREMNSLKVGTPIKVTAAKEEAKVETDGEKTVKKKVMKTFQAVVPIPLDLKGNQSKPSLRDFYKQKRPSNPYESVTVFAFYLKENLGIDKIEAGHVAACCKEVGIKTPTNITQMFYDIHRRRGWFNLGDGRRFAEINTAGDNFVIHDLPREKNAAADKTAT